MTRTERIIVLVYSTVLSIILFHYTIIKFNLPNRITSNVDPTDTPWLELSPSWELDTYHGGSANSPPSDLREERTFGAQLEDTSYSKQASSSETEERFPHHPTCNLEWGDSDPRPCSPKVFSPYIPVVNPPVVNQPDEKTTQESPNLISRKKTGLTIWSITSAKQTNEILWTVSTILVVSIFVLVSLIGTFSTEQDFLREEAGLVRQRSEETQTIGQLVPAVPVLRQTIPIPRSSTPRESVRRQSASQERARRLRGSFEPGRHLLSKNQTSISPSTITTKGVQVGKKPGPKV